LPTLKEHLESPQFTDENGESTGETVLRIGGNWVKSGVPRKKGYLFYAISFFGGLGLILTSTDGFDIFAFFGLVAVGLGIAGTIEVARGKPFTKIFGG
jgi:hypothetical protein